MTMVMYVCIIVVFWLIDIIHELSIDTPYRVAFKCIVMGNSMLEL